VDATDEDIHIIKSPVGMPGRSIFNRFLQEANDGQRRPKVCKHNCIRSCNPKTTLYCISEALLAAFKGNLKDGFAFVGSNAGRIKKISTVKEIFTELQEEYKIADKRSGKGLQPGLSH
jgi:nitronate monooxygenase